MFISLYQYLIYNRTLSLPGLGLFTIESIPARTDIASKLIMPPFYSFRFQQDNGSLSKKLFAWLSAREGISELDAIRRVNDLVYNIKSEIAAGKKVIWKGVGELSQGLAGRIEFEQEKRNFPFDQQVTAEKVIREHTEHTVLVGDKEKTVVYEMHPSAAQADLQQRSASKWWAIAVVLAFILIMILGWHFSERGVGPAASGTSKKVETKATPQTYKTVQ